MKKILSLAVSLSMLFTSSIYAASTPKLKTNEGPSSTYNSGLQYIDDRDPQTQEPTIQDFVLKNFQSPNKVEWLNTATRDTFILFNVLNPVYDNNGNLVSGDLQWAKESVVLQ